MKPSEPYTNFGLVRDMFAAADTIKNFDPNQTLDVAAAVANVSRVLMTGEGSSRIFPAKSAIAHVRRHDVPMNMQTEAGRQALEYKLDDWVVFALSNSGRTTEVIELFTQLTGAGHQHLYSLTAFENTKLESLATRGFVLSCGEEGAVAATKSVVEQAIFYRALMDNVAGQMGLAGRLKELAEQFTQALSIEIDPELIAKIANAGVIYWAGRNDGVAEELTLKTNEITRKNSDFLEGTYAVHGVEEVMNANDVVICVEPYPNSYAKFEEVLAHGVGLTVIAISSQDTPFPTIKIPDAGDLAPFVQMAAGWNILVETGIRLGVDLDKPERARKVGNEYAE